MKKRGLNGAEAVYGFAAWLTTRTEAVGPFGASHNAAQAAELCNEFCLANNLHIHRRSIWYRILVHPTDKKVYPKTL